MGSSKDPEKGYQQEVAEGVPAYYGTFQGQGPNNYPQPVPPSEAPHYASSDRNYQFQSAHGRLMEGRPLLGGEHYQNSDKLPCCNLGFGWLLFILGFFFVIPWYIGAIIFFCLAHDYRERTGLMACSIAALVMFVAGGSKAGGSW